MAVKARVPQDVRSRTDELNREYIAVNSGHTVGSRPGKSDLAASSRLLHLLERSAQTLRHTAENVENRGLKVLLKVMAQERAAMYNSLRQAVGHAPENPLDPDNKSAAVSLEEGLEDIQASMTVQRQGRENVILNHLLEQEEKLLEAYASALDGDLAIPLRNIVESQRAHVAQFYARLQAVGDGIDPIVARVFDSRADGERAVMRLQERGLDASQIDAAPITQLAQPVVRTMAAPPNPRSTMAAGAFSGALIGGLAGLALAAFVWMAPQLVGWVTVGPWALLLGAIAIGAVFGTVFGFFIGQNQREDDLAVTADSLINGEYLVVAYPTPQQIAVAEEELQVHHARELNR